MIKCKPCLRHDKRSIFHGHSVVWWTHYPDKYYFYRRKINILERNIKKAFILLIYCLNNCIRLKVRRWNADQTFSLKLYKSNIKYICIMFRFQKWDPGLDRTAVFLFLWFCGQGQRVVVQLPSSLLITFSLVFVSHDVIHIVKIVVFSILKNLDKSLLCIFVAFYLFSNMLSTSLYFDSYYFFCSLLPYSFFYTYLVVM